MGKSPALGNAIREWVVIGKKFPPTLVRDQDPGDLQDGQTPDAYGIGLNKPGLLYFDSSPGSGNAPLEATKVSGSITNDPMSATASWYNWDNRLFGFTSNSGQYTNLYYGAKGYNATYIQHGWGKVPCNMEGSAILGAVPFGDNIAVFKASYLYIVPNCINSGSSPKYSGHGDLMPAYIRLNGAMTNFCAVSLDNVLYFCTSTGVYSYTTGEGVTPLTLPLGTDYTTFTSATTTSLKVDYDKKRIVGMVSTAVAWTIDLGQVKGIYTYNSPATFRWTSPTVRGDYFEPITIDKVAFSYNYLGDTSFDIQYDILLNDEWNVEPTRQIDPHDNHAWAEIPLDNVYAVRQWAIRINSIPALDPQICTVFVHIKSGAVRSYSEGITQ